ncbi:MAG: DUF4142 domain-containing protein [Janthinobacterium lividum]
MKRAFLPLLAASLLALTSCGSSTTETATTTDTNGNNTAMKSETASDSATTTMPAAGANPDNQPATTGSAPAMAKADPKGPTAPHANDAEFMMTAAHSDQNEIQMSKMALTKGVSATAQEFANKMIADHTKSSAALKPIAMKAKVNLPADMDADHKAMVPMMEKLSGKDFEAKYMDQMMKDHQKVANTLAAHAMMTKNADLAGWIKTTLPVVEGHLGMANQDAGMKM